MHRLLSRIAAVSLACSLAGSVTRATERVHLDEGVVRWTDDNREVALFGANYGLPSASDYRAAGYLGADRKRLIEQDMAHFARLGWDGLRLAFWGDWENCDRDGNLIVNDHLDLLDYLIHCAKQRGIAMLFTPIHRHSALWPDGQDSDAIQGFAKAFRVDELGTNPAAIAAQQNYLRQILDHVNPYTGLALKDEPAIVFIELINEPEHHSDDLPGSVRYINALVDAVRDTGCEKLLFHNLSQDFRMLPAIAASKAQGFSIGWYPTALGARRTLRENYLRWADDYTPLRTELPAMPRIVYEFDSADMLSPTMYPAMVRAYREVGAQFAAMFAYDMIATAPYNLGWQTHYLNLVYSPAKAVSAIIAAEAMRTLPRGGSYGPYPRNRFFGPFRVSYEEDLSEMITAEKFLHANDTRTAPPQPEKLRQVIGVGSSPIVRYEGRGSYFIEKIDDGRWRLEVYPDALFVQDPFAQRLNHRTVSSRLIWRTWPMRIALPDLGDAFTVRPLDAGNTHAARAVDGEFAIRPGVYLLARDGAHADAPLPERLGRVGLREFVCPEPENRPPQAIPHLRSEYVTGEDVLVQIELVDEAAPAHAELEISAGGRRHSVPLRGTGGYGYEARIPADLLEGGEAELAAILETTDGKVRLPSTGGWSTRIVARSSPLLLLDAARDARRTFTLRRGWAPDGYLQPIAADGDQAAVLRLVRPQSDAGEPHVFSLPIAASITSRAGALESAVAVRLTGRIHGPLLASFVEADGTAWSARVDARNTDTPSIDVPLAALRLSNAVKLPLGYPGNWNRELTPAEGRGGAGDRLNLSRVEHLQFTALPADVGNSLPPDPIDLQRVELVFAP